MDVLLVQPAKLYPTVETSGSKRILTPMSLLYLAQPLRERGFAVHILDRAVTPLDGPSFSAYIAQHRPKIVGITSFTVTYRRALQAAAYVKSVDPAIQVVFGGAHVTFTAAQTVQHPAVDFVVRGEGDHSFTRLVEYLLDGRSCLETIPGITYRQDGEIIHNPIEIIADIETLSYPSRDLLDLSLYPVAASLYTSRGCPFACRFCCAGAMAGGKYRMRSIANIKREIDYLVDELGFRYLNFLDDTLTAIPKRAEAICHCLLEKDTPLHWFCESRVDAVNKKLIEMMAKAGCDSIQLGLESGSQEILTTIGKRITPQQLEWAVHTCLDAGLRTVGNFIIGFPEDTTETVKKTIELAKKLSLRGAVVGFGGLTPLPGTYYYEHAAELGLHIQAQDWDEYEIGVPIADTPHFTSEQLREIIFDTTTDAQWMHAATWKT